MSWSYEFELLVSSFGLRVDCFRLRIERGVLIIFYRVERVD